MSQMTGVASSHSELLKDEAANVLPSPNELDLIGSASCQDLEEDVSEEGENSLPYLDDEKGVLYDFSP